MKPFSRTVLAVYLLALLWLVLFKFSFDIVGVLLNHQSRSINFIPFFDYSQGLREMVNNFVVFIPFGLLLGVVFKHTDFWQKLAYIGAFSFIAEVAQFALAIGRTDITDVITNTLGGLVGLAAYVFGNRFINSKKFDLFIVVSGAALLAALILMRVFLLKVHYS